MSSLLGIQIIFLTFQAIFQILMALLSFRIFIYLYYMKPILLEKIVGSIAVVILIVFFFGTSGNQLATAKGDMSVPLIFSGIAFVVAATTAFLMRKNYKKILDH